MSNTTRDDCLKYLRLQVERAYDDILRFLREANIGRYDDEISRGSSDVRSMVDLLIYRLLNARRDLMRFDLSGASPTDTMGDKK